MVYVQVEIKYRDEKIKIFKCCDNPYVGDKYITLTPRESPLKRIMIPNEAIAEINWDYKNEHKTLSKKRQKTS